VFPIWEPGHFSFCFVDVKSLAIVFCDSLYSENNNCLDLIESYLMLASRDSVEAHREVPKQENGYDCGLFVPLFAEHVSRRSFLDFTQGDVSNNHLRQSVVLDIVQGKILHSACTSMRVTDDKENRPKPPLATPTAPPRQPHRPRRVLGDIQANC